MTAKRTTRKKAPTREELRRRNLNLICRLTEEEIAERQESLVEWTTIRAHRELDLERWKAEKKEQQKLHEGEIVTAAAKVERFAKVIHDKEEYRDVEVIDFISGSTVTTIRTDTGEVVGERAAEDHELQRKLALEEAKKKEEKP